MDKDGDGFLDATEFKDWDAGRFHTREAMRRLLKTADADEDGHLSAEELAGAAELISNDAGEETDALYHLMQWVEPPKASHGRDEL